MENFNVPIFYIFFSLKVRENDIVLLFFFKGRSIHGKFERKSRYPEYVVLNVILTAETTQF